MIVFAGKFFFFLVTEDGSTVLRRGDNTRAQSAQEPPTLSQKALCNLLIRITVNCGQ